MYAFASAEKEIERKGEREPSLTQLGAHFSVFANLAITLKNVTTATTTIMRIIIAQNERRRNIAMRSNTLANAFYLLDPHEYMSAIWRHHSCHCHTWHLYVFFLTFSSCYY